MSGRNCGANGTWLERCDYLNGWFERMEDEYLFNRDRLSLEDKLALAKNRARKIMEYRHDDLDRRFHVYKVVEISRKLAQQRRLNKYQSDVCEIGALLHDIARANGPNPKHPKEGAEMARKILGDIFYSRKVIDDIYHVIEAHDGDVNPRSEMAEIVRNADALAHFENLPHLIYVSISKIGKGDLEKGMNWAESKLRRELEEKITYPDVRERCRRYYESFEKWKEGLNHEE